MTIIVYGYIYITTNLVNGKIYIGQCKSSKFKTNYKGSGKILRLAFSKYGWDSFETHLIEWCESKDELNRQEIYWIAKYNSTKHEIGYNLSLGGSGGNLGPEWVASCIANHTHATKGRVRSQEERDNVSKGMKEYKRLHGKGTEGYVPPKRKPLSPETRAKISAKMKGNKNGIGHSVPQSSIDALYKCHEKRRQASKNKSLDKE